MNGKATEYISKWEKQGYKDGIPEEVPSCLMKNKLAPSYKAIAISILKNDNGSSLGFSTKKSIYYDAIKTIEINNRQA